MIWPMTRLDLLADPFHELNRLQREVNRLFQDASGAANRFPAVNLWGTADEAVIAAEIPGVDPKSVHLTVLGNVLTIEGERPAETGVAPTAYHRCEREPGRFVRTVRLPFDVEGDKVTAKAEHGILRINLPRKESTKPRRIAITAE